MLLLSAFVVHVGAEVANIAGKGRIPIGHPDLVSVRAGSGLGKLQRYKRRDFKCDRLHGITQNRQGDWLADFQSV